MSTIKNQIVEVVMSVQTVLQSTEIIRPKYAGCNFYLRRLVIDVYDMVVILQDVIGASNYTMEEYDYNITEYCLPENMNDRVQVDLALLNGIDEAIGYSLGITSSSVSDLCVGYFNNYDNDVAIIGLTSTFNSTYFDGCGSD